MEHSLCLLGIDVMPLRTLINGGEKEDPSYVFPQRKMTDIALFIGANVRVKADVNGNTVYRYYPARMKYNTTIRLCRVGDQYYPDETLECKTASWKVLTDLQLSNPESLEIRQGTGATIPASLNYITQNQSIHSYDKKHRGKFTVSYADIETVCTPRHIPLMYGRYCNGAYRSVSCGADVEWEGFGKFLRTFPDGLNIVYFHNLKFDWTVIKRNPHMRLRSIVKKDGEYYCVTFSYYGKVFELRDSYKYVTASLAKFPSMFDLGGLKKHDLILYDLYTIENTTNADYVSYRHMREEDTPTAVYDISSTGVTKALTSFDYTNYILLDERVAVQRKYIDLVPRYFSINKYYHISHCEYYLHSDCEILYRGMEAYRQRIQKIMNVDCHNYLTLPSIVHDTLCAAKCYDGVWTLQGDLRRFVTESVAGGRVVTKDNKMWDVRGRIHVIDGRSLYPSAIFRLCNPTAEDRGRCPGLPIGQAKKILDWSRREEFHHYVVRVNITAIGKYQQIPFVTYREGTREYTNTCSSKLHGLVLDKITLEDWITYQDIEYEFIEGVYWQDGGNTTIGNIVGNLYNERRKYIDEGNISMSEVCKLALNSLYGKTIVTPNDVKHIIKDNSKVPDYIAKNFDTLIEMEECATQSIISLTNNNTMHSNMAHIGGLILSMSRRIMNEVLDTANTLGIPVLNTDTDSMHVVGDTLPLEEEYMKRYGRKLIGQNLGQFSFELKYPGHTDIHSERMIVLAKKVYMHQVVGTVDGRTEMYPHCRMKGVNTFAMDEYPNKIELYERMYQGETVPFNLAYGDGVSFQYADTVISRDVFIRKMTFTGEKGTI